MTTTHSQIELESPKQDSDGLGADGHIKTAIDRMNARTLLASILLVVGALGLIVLSFTKIPANTIENFIAQQIGSEFYFVTPVCQLYMRTQEWSDQSLRLRGMESGVSV